MADELFLTLVEIIRRFELDQSEFRAVERRLVGKSLRRTRGLQVGLYRLADAEAAVTEARQERAEHGQGKRPAATPPTWPCPGCGVALSKHWIFERCHNCMGEAA